VIPSAFPIFGEDSAMGAKRSSKGKKGGVSKEKELMEGPSANLSRREIREILFSFDCGSGGGRRPGRPHSQGRRITGTAQPVRVARA
jgi:hypothetical protein